MKSEIYMYTYIVRSTNRGCFEAVRLATLCDDNLIQVLSLHRLGVPSRLVIFPDENHWVLNHGNRLVMLDFTGVKTELTFSKFQP